jgi:hypothetical protein
MEIHIKTIPHNEHRYSGTVGDYWEDENGVLQIRVSKMGNEDYEYLVAGHELREAYLCKKRGIAEPDITAFDIQFGIEGGQGEPGDDPRAPYRKEHFFSTSIERLEAAELGVDWQKYDEAIIKLFE